MGDTLQALVYDIFPSRTKVPKSDTREWGGGGGGINCVLV